MNMKFRPKRRPTSNLEHLAASERELDESEQSLISSEDELSEIKQDLEDSKQALIESQSLVAASATKLEEKESLLAHSTQDLIDKAYELVQSKSLLDYSEMWAGALVDTNEKLKERNEQLREANEQLMVSSVRLLEMTEELEKAKSEMGHMAHHDYLTDLPNRRFLHDRIAKEIALAKDGNLKLAVLFLDLDHFKPINDTLGHAVGDELLQMIAGRLKSVLRSTDAVGRLGGDEFVIVLSDIGTDELLRAKVEEIHRTLIAPYAIRGGGLDIGVTVGVTIGVSQFPYDGNDSETLIRNADFAMYQAKNSGRNKYECFKPI
jgi:diguanylate cyclase (GGDEF)-like protein